MRHLSEAEILSLTSVLKMETDGLNLAKPMSLLIGDEDLKRQMDAGILGTEGKIKSIQQFISENQISTTRGDE